MIDLSDFENFHFENFLKKKRIGVLYSSDFDYIDFILKSLTLRRPICRVRQLIMFFVFHGRVSNINLKLPCAADRALEDYVPDRAPETLFYFNF